MTAPLRAVIVEELGAIREKFGEERRSALEIDPGELDIEDLPVVVAIDDALAEGAPLLYPEAGTNLLATFHGGDSAEHTASVFAAIERAAASARNASAVNWPYINS